jgi:hypothetical protein
MKFDVIALMAAAILALHMLRRQGLASGDVTAVRVRRKHSCLSQLHLQATTFYQPLVAPQKQWGQVYLNFTAI